MSDYVRRDDLREVVRVIEQERTPNGKVWYHMIQPRLSETKRCLHGDRFFALYRPIDEKYYPPMRPDAEATKEEWRRYALHLEKIYGN